MTWSGAKMAHLGAVTPPLAETTVRLDRVPASRQKSCNACVRGKRRCDKRTPNCTRCAAKGLDCIYQRLPPASTLSEAPAMADFDMGFDMEGLSTDTSPCSLQTDLNLQLDPVLDFSIEHLVSGGSVDSLSPSTDGQELCWDLPHDFGPSKMDLPPVPTIPELPLRDVSLLKNIGDECHTMDVEFARLYDPDSRIGYIFKFLGSMHGEFVKTRALPFMHPRLWPSPAPKTIMAAYSAANAQANSSPQNKGWTCRLIMDAARDVHREGELADTPQEKLARVQALLIVQAIKIFDGDIVMRSTAEREMNVLVAWSKDLEIVLNQLQDGKAIDELTSREKPPATWESWILAESIRRTIVMSVSISCLMALLQSREIPFRPWSDLPFFTASRPLWEATSSLQFYRSWRGRRQFPIKSFGFAEFWQYGRPDDLDEFTKMLLTTQAGPDLMEQFRSDDGTIPI
ncbi:Transcription factor gsfR2 [Paramyrothecium foliicola]|nr:Transcription factor gsfR2 [Paramyrothecium foliicola]